MHTYALNIAVVTSRKNWDGNGFAFAHFAFIELGDNEQEAREKAAVFVASLGKEKYQFTFRVTPKARMTSEEL